MIKDLIGYILSAKSIHAVHSPFVFDFCKNVLNVKYNTNRSGKIEALRKALLKIKNTILIEDFGAKSKLNNATQKSIKSIARYGAKPKKYAQLLARIIEYYAYKNIVDLGTSLGLTTAYLAQAAEDVRIISFEGCRNTSTIAEENFEKLGVNNVEFKIGNIDDTLPLYLKSLDFKIDFMFFDANHQYQATVNYFNWALDHTHLGTCFVFDDIYWSDDMKKAWTEIKKHPQVIISIDLYQIGLIFFDNTKQKQDFRLRF